jgi:GxxExxY protein
MGPIEPLPEELEYLAAEVAAAASKVHAALGPGLLESVYEICLCREFSMPSMPGLEKRLVVGRSRE